MAAERTVSGPLAQLPNALTVARLVVIPVYAALILACRHGYDWSAAVLFGAAGVTDQIDGFLARRWHVESEFGKIADPLADRLLIDVAVVLLWHAGRLPWAAFAIPARDCLPDRDDAVRARPRLPVRGQPARQARHLAPLREPRARDGRTRRLVAALDLLGRVSRSRSSRCSLYLGKARQEIGAARGKS